MCFGAVELLLRCCSAEDGDLSGMRGCTFQDEMCFGSVDLLLRNCSAEDGDLSEMLGCTFQEIGSLLSGISGSSIPSHSLLSF